MDEDFATTTTASADPNDSASQPGALRRASRHALIGHNDHRMIAGLSQLESRDGISRLSGSRVPSTIDLDEELAAAERRMHQSDGSIDVSRVSILSAKPVALRLGLQKPAIVVNNGKSRPISTAFSQDPMYGELMEELRQEISPKSPPRHLTSRTLPDIPDQYISKEELESMYRALRPSLRRKDLKPLSDFMKTIGPLVDVEHPFANQIISSSRHATEEEHQNHSDTETSSSRSPSPRQRPSEAIIEKGKALREMTHRHDTTRQARLHMRHFAYKGARPMNLIRQEIHREELQELRLTFGAGMEDPYRLTYQALSDAERAEEERTKDREEQRKTRGLFERRQNKGGNVTHTAPEDTGKQSPSAVTSRLQRSMPEAVLSDTPAVETVDEAIKPETGPCPSSVAMSTSTLDFVDSARSKTRSGPKIPPRISTKPVAKAGPNSPGSPTYEPAIPSPLRKASSAGKEAWWK